MVRVNDDGSLDEEELVREGGVFVSRHGGHEADDGSRAADDYVEDPGTGDGVPGTVDDLPYDLGLENATPVDQLVQSPDFRLGGHGGVGETQADDDSEPAPLGRPEERELWKKQRGLIQESADEDARYAGLNDEEIAALDAASGEDAADVLPDSPEGKSATGAE